MFFCDKNWHAECFTCTVGNCSFDTDDSGSAGEFYSKDALDGRGELPYCSQHFHAKFAVKCTSCMQPISNNDGDASQFVSANSMPFHVDCFQCTVCRDQLDGDFFSEGGHFYCEDDYFQTFGDTCFGCQDTIRDEILQANDHTWHVNCFKCYHCNEALEPNSFFSHGSRIFCETCFCKSGHAEQCACCAKHIVEGGVKMILGTTKDDQETFTWHPECATCAQCSRRMDPTTKPDLFKLDDNHVLYCTEHFQQLFQEQCDICWKKLDHDVEQYLEWPIAAANGEEMMVRYHYSCVTCVGCDVPLLSTLDSGSYHAQIDELYSKSGDVPSNTIGTYCQDCHVVLHAQSCTLCGEHVQEGQPSKALADGTHWHEECFACIFCDTGPIVGSIHPWKNEKNVFCCKEHFIAEFLPTCIGCDVAILVKPIEIFGQPYHMDCITCVECSGTALDAVTKQVKGRKIAGKGGEVAVHSWLVCGEHQAPVELSVACLAVVHARCARVEEKKVEGEERTGKHVALLEARRTKLIGSALKMKDVEGKKEKMEVKIALFYKSGGGRGGNQGESKRGETSEVVVPVGWRKLVDADGELYYEEVVSGRTQWVLPVAR